MQTRSGMSMVDRGPDYVRGAKINETCIVNARFEKLACNMFWILMCTFFKEDTNNAIARKARTNFVHGWREYMM